MRGYRVIGWILVALGVLIILGSVGVITFSFWELLLWIFAIGFLANGLFTITRWFPSGIVSLTLGILLILHLTGSVRLTFWGFVGALVGAWLIQVGLSSLIGWEPGPRWRRMWW